MDTSAPDKTSMLGLLRLLTGDTRTFIRQEIQLVKTELSEKASHFGRNVVLLAAWGAIAYAGLIVFLISLSWLVAWLFEIAGLQPVLAGFLGLVIIGGLVIAAGCVLLLKGLKTLKKERLAPERTIRTLQELKGNGPAQSIAAKTEPIPSPSSAEMQARVEATEDRMVDTIDELGRRLSPQHINAEIKQRIQANPYRSGLIAMGAGLISGLLLRGRLRRA